MAKIRLAYFAGIIDGEGSIQITKKTCTGKPLILSVSVGMCNPLVPYALKERFGGTIINRPIGQCSNKKPFWQWRVQATIALACLEAIFPFLLEKKGQAQVGICFQKKRRGKGYRIPQSQRVIEEAQHILLKSCHKGGYNG